METWRTVEVKFSGKTSSLELLGCMFPVVSWFLFMTMMTVWAQEKTRWQ